MKDRVKKGMKRRREVEDRVGGRSRSRGGKGVEDRVEDSRIKGGG